MSESKQTWNWWTSNSWKRLIASDGRGHDTPILVPYVARDGHPDCDISKEHMALIASAPDLLEALKDATHRVRWLLQFVSDQEPVKDELRKWDTALAKAEAK